MINLTFVAIGLGWLIAIYCILRKHDFKKDDNVCLARDIITATFTSITLAFVVSLSIEIFVKLEDTQASNSTLRAKLRETQEIIGDLESQNAYLTSKNVSLIAEKRLSSEISQMRAVIETFAAEDTTIIDELISLAENNNLNKPQLAQRPIQKHFGVGHAVHIDSLNFTFEVNPSNKVSCTTDGDISEGLFCSEAN